jgi:hypothetical protein
MIAAATSGSSVIGRGPDTLYIGGAGRGGGSWAILKCQMGILAWLPGLLDHGTGATADP